MIIKIAKGRGTMRLPLKLPATMTSLELQVAGHV